MPRQKLKPPVPEQPYFPSRGWNPDANGLSIKQDECVDTLNMRISGHSADRRSGSRELADNLPSNDPVLHEHNQKDTDGIEKIYAFTKDTVWEYRSTSSLWTYASKYEIIDSCEAIDDWVSDNYTPTVTTNKFEGTNAIYIPITGNIADIEVLLGKEGVGVLDWDLSPYTHVTLQYFHEFATAIDAKIKFYSDNASSVLVESFDVTLNTSNTLYNELAVKMTVPANWTSIKSWEIVADGGETVASTFNLTVDYICGVVKLANDVAFWHTTRFSDGTIGETVVAAGSTPPLFDEPEADGSTRVLLYYDTTNNYFTTLSQFRNVAIGDEDTTVNGPATASIVTSNSALTNAGTVLGGSFSIYTAEFGTLATASSIVNGDLYRLIPTDTTRIQGGSASWIKIDGSAWSLSFLSTEYEGLKLYVAYTYKEAVSFNPRFVWSFNNRLLMGNTYETATYYPFRVRWSELGDIDLAYEVSYADLVDKDIAGIVAGDLLGFYLTIYKTSSVVKCSYVGGSSVFLFTTVWEEGTYAGRTLQSFRNRHYLLSKNDVVVWDGMKMWSITKTLGEDKSNYRTRSEIFTTLNSNKINNCFGAIFPRFKEYWLFITGTDETYPTRAFIYSILKDIWYFFNFATGYTCANLFNVQNEPTIDELIGTIDEQNWLLSGGYTEGKLLSLVLGKAIRGIDYLDDTMATDSGYIQADGTWVPGAAISSRLISRDFIFNQLQLEDRVQQLDLEAQGGDIDVSYARTYTRLPGAFDNAETITLNTTYTEQRYFPDTVGQHIRFMIESTVYWSIRWLQPYAVITEFQNE